MSASGFLGFVIDGREKIAYNHSGSYPDVLGVDVLRWLRTAARAGLGTIVAQARALRLVDPDAEPPTPKDVQRLRRFAVAGLGVSRVVDWTNLLHHTYGKPRAILDAGVALEAGDMPADSVMAQWGYVVDLDTYRFELYRGLQRHPHDEGRFARRRSSWPGTHPVRLVSAWPVAELPTESEFLAAAAAERE